MVADLVSLVGRASHGAVPAEIQLAASEPPVFTAGGPYVQGPLPPGRSGAETVVQVQNLSSVDVGTGRVTFLNGAGEAVAPARDVSLCPRGTAALLVPGRLESASPAVSVRVESQPWLGRDGATTPATNVSATVIQRRTGPAGDVLLSYTLLGPADNSPWPPGLANRGARLLAVPLLASDVTGVTRLAVTNAVADSGATNVVVLVYDANGPLTTHCLQLVAGATAWLDLAELDMAGSSFRGSAVISAASWRHPVFNLRATRSAIGWAWRRWP